VAAADVAAARRIRAKVRARTSSIHDPGGAADYGGMIARPAAKPGSLRHLILLTGAVVLGLTVTAGGAGPSPSDSLAWLKAGNSRFVAAPADARTSDATQRATLAKGQSPFATVLSCADSRVPPEAIFRATLGELFVIRAAGHVADHAVLASVEYAAEHLHVPLVVVMGHEMCGAVKAAVETPAATSLGPNLDYLLKAIRPAVARTAGQPADSRLRAAILENVEETINDLLVKSALLRQLAEADRIAVVGAYYELATGRVHFSEMVHVPAAPAGVKPAATASH
jgi:carbonic anhydrase